MCLESSISFSSLDDRYHRLDGLRNEVSLRFDGVNQLLIDDAAGRDEAIARGLQTIGTLGILREAHRSRFLHFGTDIVRLRALGFYVSQPLVQTLLNSL